jgi:hypothetical protein
MILTPERAVSLLGDPRRAEAKYCGLWPTPKGKIIANINPKVYMNKAMMPYWNTAYLEIYDKGLKDLIVTWDGWFNIRKVYGTNKWSLHAWGLCFDCNAKTNKQGTKGDMPKVIVDIFKNNGFDWGGDFKGTRIDPMHMQIKEELLLDYLKQKNSKQN